MDDFLTLKDLKKEDLIALLDLADDIKKEPNKYSSTLNYKTLILLFQKTSTRTRISFESGMYQLGGNAIFVDWRTTNLHLGALRDEITCMSSYADILLARVYEHETIEVIKDASHIPVINGLSDTYHPSQALADLMTIREKLGSFENVKVAWSGDGNNMCNSLIIGCTLVNVPILVATPSQYKPHPDVIEWAKSQEGSQLTITENPKDAIEQTNIIYTDTFVSMGQEEESKERLEAFKPYQVNKELLSHAKGKPYIMHCLPAHRGVEITDEVLDSKNSIVFEQAENRLHVQKALLLTLLKK